MKKTLVVRFSIGSTLIYLSHHELMDMFTRALVRANVNLCYSEGYNPRPRVFLPFPKPVGVKSHDELLYAFIEQEQPDLTVEKLAANIAEQLPAGCDITDIKLEPYKTTFKPVNVCYVFVTKGPKDKQLAEAVDKFNAAIRTGQTIFIDRKVENKPAKKVDIGKYIECITLLDNNMQIRCSISPSGTVRVDELMELFGLNAEDIDLPVERKQIKWQQN